MQMSIIVEHVSCPIRLMFREIEDGGVWGAKPPREAGGVGGPPGPPMMSAIRTTRLTKLNFCFNAQALDTHMYLLRAPWFRAIHSPYHTIGASISCV